MGKLLTRGRGELGNGNSRTPIGGSIKPKGAAQNFPLAPPLNEFGHRMLLSLKGLGRPARALVVAVAFAGLYWAVTDRPVRNWFDRSRISLPVGEESFCSPDVWAERGQWRRKQGLTYLPKDSFGADTKGILRGR